jgi:hypothetical protein
VKVSDFDQLGKIAKYGGVYLLEDIEDRPLYVGHAKKMSFGTRFNHHYGYLKNLVHSITIYPTDEHQLLEYTLIQRLNPIHNGDREWNRITQGKYGSTPYLLSQPSFWGHKFYKKGCLPFEMNSPEDHKYLQGVEWLIKELKKLGKTN